MVGGGGAVSVQSGGRRGRGGEVGVDGGEGRGARGRRALRRTSRRLIGPPPQRRQDGNLKVAQPARHNLCLLATTAFSLQRIFILNENVVINTAIVSIFRK